jgi:hypothetical protein
MTISAELLSSVAAWIEADGNPSRASALTALRAQFPGVMLTECSEDDVPARLSPALESARYLFFLFTSVSGHCLEFTTDADLATGIVVAARVEEDDA